MYKSIIVVWSSGFVYIEDHLFLLCFAEQLSTRHTGMGCGSQVFVSNLIDLGYWEADKVTYKHFRATSYHTTEMNNCSAKHRKCVLKAENLHVSWS